jgi:hypothetical protein
MTSVREDSGNWISNYLTRVEAGLKGGDEGQRQEILAEIRSHLTDRIEELKLQGAENPTEVALAAMGDPDALSMQFIAEGVARDSRSRFPWVLLRAAARVATTGMRGTLVLLLGVVGYAAAFALIAAAVAKVLDPAGVGFWVGPHTGVIWGYPSDTADAHELAGRSFGYISIILGFFFLSGTTVLLQRLLQSWKSAKRTLHSTPSLGPNRVG